MCRVKMSEQKKILENEKPEMTQKFGIVAFFKEKRWARILIILIVVLALVGTGVGLAYRHVMYKPVLSDTDTTEDDDGVLDDELATKPELQKKYMNVLLCGVDYKENTARGKLTDVMMVIHLDFEQQTVDILQLPRDTYIGRDYSTGKLNAIYGARTNGGIENLARKISRMLKVPLDYYVMVDMDGFEDIVDSIGGVTVDSPYAFKLEGVSIVKGVQTLNGRAANKFVRERHAYADGDLTRMRMQQIFVKALAKKVLGLGKTEIVKLAPKVFQYLSTDMTLNRALEFYHQFSGMTLESMQFHSCEVSAFTDPYDRLSKLSIHVRPLADTLNVYFREGGETVNWTELEMVEYVTNYSYDGEQNQYAKEPDLNPNHSVQGGTPSRPASSRNEQHSSSRPSSQQSSSASESAASSASESEIPDTSESVSDPEPPDSSGSSSEASETSSEPSAPETSESTPPAASTDSSAVPSDSAGQSDDPLSLREE